MDLQRFNITNEFASFLGVNNEQTVDILESNVYIYDHIIKNNLKKTDCFNRYRIIVDKKLSLIIPDRLLIFETEIYLYVLKNLRVNVYNIKDIQLSSKLILYTRFVEDCLSKSMLNSLSY